MTFAQHGAMADRRGSLRIEVPVGDADTIVTDGRLLNVSPGGFALESTTPFDSGLHVFEFAVADRMFLTLRAAAVHSMRVAGSGTTPRYVTGFAFAVDEDADDIAQLLKAVMEKAAPIAMT